MPRSNLSRSDKLAGPYRGKILDQDISTVDYVDERGFTITAKTAGTLTYLTLDRVLAGSVGDQTETLAVGDTIAGPGSAPVLLVAVRMSSGITTIDIGIP